MPCNCGKKTVGNYVDENTLHTDPLKWGPVLWKYLHTLAEHLGFSGNSVVDTDQANYTETILTSLHLIIPCQECQSHSANYISNHPVPSLKGLQGEILRTTVRGWLFSFHNNVRITKQQPIVIHTPEECAATYAGNRLSKNEYSIFVQSVAYAIRQGWVRVTDWRKWYSNSERLRLITGIIV